MSVTLTERDDRIQSGYWRYLHTHHLPASEELEDCYSAAWLAGGKQVLRDSAQLAELVPLLRALIAWFEADE